MIKSCIIIKGQEYMVLYSGKTLLECIKGSYMLWLQNEQSLLEMVSLNRVEFSL